MGGRAPRAGAGTQMAPDPTQRPTAAAAEVYRISDLKNTPKACCTKATPILNFKCSDDTCLNLKESQLTHGQRN